MSVKLIDCPACKAQVSSQAAACPRCGHPVAASLAPPAPVEPTKEAPQRCPFCGSKGMTARVAAPKTVKRVGRGLRGLITARLFFLIANRNFKPGTVRMRCNRCQKEFSPTDAGMATPVPDPVELKPAQTTEGLSLLHWVWILLVVFGCVCSGGFGLFNKGSSIETPEAPDTKTPAPAQPGPAKRPVVAPGK